MKCEENIKKCEEKLNICTPMHLPCFSNGGNSGQADSELKTQENTSCTPCSSLFLIKRYIDKKNIEGSTREIYIEKVFKKKGGTQEHGYSFQNIQNVKSVSEKYPYLESPELSDRLKLLLSVYNKQYSMENIDWLVLFYKEAKLDLWDCLAGVVGINVPTGMVEPGVYFAGTSGRAIKPNWFGEP
jgi:hypothetical protein